MLELNRIYNCDCMDGMAQFPDKYFDLAIVDPPYGIGEDGERSTRAQITQKWKNAKAKNYNLKKWDNKSPDESYFKELMRVSRNQIIWGANHFISKMPYDGSCWVVWDKLNGENDFADCELAWTSFKSAVRKFSWLWNGFQKQKPEKRFHPTQKPVALYTWLLNNYAKQGYKILDTHLGSASSIVACIKSPLKLQYIGFEIDKDYFNLAQKRINDELAQVSLFEAADSPYNASNISIDELLTQGRNKAVD